MDIKLPLKKNLSESDLLNLQPRPILSPIRIPTAKQLEEHRIREVQKKIEESLKNSENSLKEAQKKATDHLNELSPTYKLNIKEQEIFSYKGPHFFNKTPELKRSISWHTNGEYLNVSVKLFNTDSPPIHSNSKIH